MIVVHPIFYRFRRLEYGISLDLIFDSKEESFLLKIPYIPPEEHTVVINAIDAEGNAGSNRIVFNP